MEIRILKNEDGYVKLTIRATDPHTLFNLLREELLKDSDVDFAGYWRYESFYESIIFQLRMKRKTGDPIAAINKALDGIKKQTNDFISVCRTKLT